MEARSLLSVSPRQSYPKEIIKSHVQMPLPCGINSLMPEKYSKLIRKKSSQTKSLVKKRQWKSDKGRQSKWLRGEKCPTGVGWGLNAEHQAMGTISILNSKAMFIATVMKVTASRISNIYEASTTLRYLHLYVDTTIITPVGSWERPLCKDVDYIAQGHLAIKPKS